MQIDQPSRTAWAAAAHRATHQVIDGGRVFNDPIAVKVLGIDADVLRREADATPGRRRMRWFIAARTRFAEDALTDAFNHGVSQLVILGAGLDTYAYRGPLREQLRMFEVDHPATQAWKRQQLEAANIRAPETLTYAPIDFEHETLANGLAAAGFDATEPTFFMWLGVVPYLTEVAILDTLRFIANLPSGAEVVLDYANPPTSLGAERQVEQHQERAAFVASLGEPWITYFDTATLSERLTALGFDTIEDLNPSEIARRYFGIARGPSREHGGHFIRASSLSRLRRK